MKSSVKTKFSQRNTRLYKLQQNNKSKVKTRTAQSENKKITNNHDNNLSSTLNLKKIKKRSLTVNELDELYKNYAEMVEVNLNILKVKYPKKNLDPLQNLELKRCEECRDFINDQYIILCDICDDAFHIYCLDPPMESLPPENENFYCKYCIEQYPVKKSKQSLIEDKFELSKISKEKVQILNLNSKSIAKNVRRK